MRLEMQSTNRNELSFVLMRIIQLILEWINTRRSCQPAAPPATGLDGTKGGRPRWFLITTETVMQIGGRGELHVSNKHALLRSYRQITCLPFTPRAIKPLLAGSLLGGSRLMLAEAKPTKCWQMRSAKLNGSLRKSPGRAVTATMLKLG
ncbi:unnamed protein product [Danaus chrysippus]|uniref:(African queen) hypothetical protein n=1 Tax=Danaus chrysippus TaxID=151541 RepID=A0A8J2QPF7_9NEOP|nr:unnamed protein product [Danaus chrysippus]